MSDPNETIGVTVNGVRPAGGVSRRQAMQWVLGAMAASSLQSIGAIGGAPALGAPGAPTGEQTGNGAVPIPATKPAGQIGYGTDPNLVAIHKPGDLWPLTFSEAQKKTATALADTIIPKDKLGPAASEVGVVEMVDEWVSAPYERQKGDRPVVLDGLAWLEAESTKRFQAGFAEATAEQKKAICDDICFEPAATPPFKKGAQFFSRFRSLCASAYYGTPAGWESIGYVGNVALASFDGPPPDVLQKLGVTQTVK